MKENKPWEIDALMEFLQKKEWTALQLTVQNMIDELEKAQQRIKELEEENTRYKYALQVISEVSE